MTDHITLRADYQHDLAARETASKLAATLELLLKSDLDQAALLNALQSLRMIPEGATPQFQEETVEQLRHAIEAALKELDPSRKDKEARVQLLEERMTAVKSKITPVVSAATAESAEVPPALQAIITKMKATAEKHNYFGFGSQIQLNAFLEQLHTKLSADSLATIKALKPRETEESYTVFFRHGNEIFMGESAPSSKGPNGEPGGGVKIAATKAAKDGYQDAPAGYYSQIGSAEELFAELNGAGAQGITRASKSMLNTLKSLGLFSSEVPVEWLSDSAASGRAWVGYAEAAYSVGSSADSAYERRGVRALRNVSTELGS